jgi:nucleoid DNA-binding protein
MNQADLIAAVAAHAGLTKADAGKAVEALVGSITGALKRGEEIRIAGFGTFGISERGGPQSSDRRADHDRRVQGCQVHRRQGRQGRPQRLSRWARFSRDPRAPPTEGGSRRSSPKAAAVEKQSGRQPQQPGSPLGVPGVVRCALSAGTRKGP